MPEYTTIPTSDPFMAERVPSGANGLRSYLKRFLTQWITEDPEPRYSSLDMHNGLSWNRAGNAR